MESFADFSHKEGPIYTNLEDLIFNVTPFMAHLVDNIECSFFTKNEFVIVSDLTETNLYEIMYRLGQCNMIPRRIDCHTDMLYRLSINEVDMRDDAIEGSFSSSLKVLKEMAKAFSGMMSSISLHSDEVHITNVSLEDMETVAQVLKSMNVKPKCIFSDSNSLYSFELLVDDISCHQEGEYDDDSFQPQITINNDYFTCLRSLRANLISSNERVNLDNLGGRDTLLSSIKNGDLSSFLPFSLKTELVNRGRGRPKKMSPTEDLPKRKRGRPRLTDFQTFFPLNNSKLFKDSSIVSEPSIEEDQF